MCVDTTASVSTKVMGTSQRCEVGAEQTMRWLFCRAFFSSMPRALLGLDDLTIIVDGTGISAEGINVDCYLNITIFAKKSWSCGREDGISAIC